MLTSVLDLILSKCVPLSLVTAFSASLATRIIYCVCPAVANINHKKQTGENLQARSEDIVTGGGLFVESSTFDSNHIVCILEFPKIKIKFSCVYEY